jgi:hypothetical protein
MDIRTEILRAIEKEVVGPSPNPEYLDMETGEELLLDFVHGAPYKRYGAGMLYPIETPIIEETPPEGEDGDTSELDYQVDKVEVPNSKDLPIDETEIPILEDNSSSEEPVGLANNYYPSAMGFTVRFSENQKDDEVVLNINSAYYEKGKGKKVKKKKTVEHIIEETNKNGEPVMSNFWIRRPINCEPIFLNLKSLFRNGEKSYDQVLFKTNDAKEKDWLKLRIFNRTTKKDRTQGYLTYTFTIINAIKSSTEGPVRNQYILYQNEFSLSTRNPQLIVPYEERISFNDTDEEEELNLLYRGKRIFSIGHGVSVKWTLPENGKGDIFRIQTAAIPYYEMPQIAPTSHVSLSMLELSDLGDWNRAKNSLRVLIEEYSSWIDKLEKEIDKPVFLNYKKAAERNIEKCKKSLARIRRGVDTLTSSEEDSKVVKCFRWMNRAMIWQQQRSKTDTRKWIKRGGKNQKDYILQDAQKEFLSLNEFHNNSEHNGRWRPFQLAFVLMNLESVIKPESKERSIVDLIWFPTGGGKTEAYLGLAALTILYRRIQGEATWNWEMYGGTAVIMRYTLRLLTTQQYERAASMICACDLIRRKNEKDLGYETISIGLWVGGASTPNSDEKAINEFNHLVNHRNATYNFVVMKCPCCAAQIGNEGIDTVKGLKQVGEGKNRRIVFQCDNKYCDYHDIPLPLQVVDEQIYQSPPTLLLGTVDKFAMIPWKENTGKLFGFRWDEEGTSRVSPPELIIQDELHLISGPLGTMVGLYETMIQTLCNNYHKSSAPFLPEDMSNFIPPKIVASSATISRAFDQVRSLYGITSKEEQLSIFPAQGLSFGDTWFSEEKEIGEKHPGRIYAGILPPGYPSAQTTIVRTYATAIQKVGELRQSNNDLDIDYYWTILGYFNSIRELGGASSLVYGDIKERLHQIQHRELLPVHMRRNIRDMKELTSRIDSSSIPSVLKKLEASLSSTPLDVCLATNMVATGVDVSRLGLMFIHGQPKTTAEYIQASSRVGRRVPQGPGLIFTLYSPTKPRDKSQYEQFQAYHERIYSNVEPTSVTPFSVNARDRGLHAVLIGLVRHFADGSLRHFARITDEREFNSLTDLIKGIILKRCDAVDKNEMKNTEKLLNKKISHWKNEGFQYYGDAGGLTIKNQAAIPLMYTNKPDIDSSVKEKSLLTPTSMRGVDTESILRVITRNKINHEE